MILEFLLPGLVSVFVGLAALTVGFLYHYGIIESILLQALLWMIISLIYCFTLRILVIKIYPTDTEIQNVNEDIDIIGSIVEVVESIPENGEGRVLQGDSTWPAKSKNGEAISDGEKVKIVERDNITWIVSK
jgi:membrane protein implicated in regulation of membrane protease activity